MSRIQEAIQEYKTQQFGRERNPSHPASRNALKPIVYSQTKSLEISIKQLRDHRILTANSKGVYSDSFKILRTQVLTRLREHQWNTLAITSPGHGEGKTLTAINLAVTLAMEETQTVLLVDTNLRKPSIHNVFGLEDPPGLVNYLLDDDPLEDLLIHPGLGRFLFLPGGRHTENSTELLTSPKMINLVNELKSRYASRLIIFDLPPVLDSADALAFSPYTDSALVVTEEGHTTTEELERSLRLLQDNVPIIGTILNKAGKAIPKKRTR